MDNFVVYFAAVAVIVMALCWRWIRPVMRRRKQWRMKSERVVRPYLGECIPPLRED